ncbi:MAG: penicillin-binding protein [Deltaproteobacteria bacterium]|nr:penicillin-binding protein [Deltaproteobacteria bacterium]
MRICSAMVLAVLAVSTSLQAEQIPVAKPEAVGMSSPRLERIGQVLRADVESGRMPGAVVAIARKGKQVYYEAFGFLDKTARTPMLKDAIFSIASMTKPMATVGALMLVEEGRLLLNDPVGEYLPQLGKMSVAVMRPGTAMGSEAARRQPTIQDLMRHTAGFTYGNRGTSELYKMYPQGSIESASLTGPQFIEKLATLPLHYQPGTVWDYSLGLDVLGLAIEAVTKQPLSRFLNERLFAPLGMVDTGFVLTAEKARRLARALPVDPETGNQLKYPFISDRRQRRMFDCGGACAFSTATDYLRFAQMLLNRGALEDTRILGRKTVEFMTADQLGPEVNTDRLRDSPNINGYGFGLSVAVRRGSGVAGVMGSPGDYHWGGAMGTFFWVDPKEELAVVFMAATPGATRLHYRQVITSLVLQAIAD